MHRVDHGAKCKLCRGSDLPSQDHPDRLDDWLRAQSSRARFSICSRAALRFVPHLSGVLDRLPRSVTIERRNQLILAPTVRAISTAWSLAYSSRRRLKKASFIKLVNEAEAASNLADRIANAAAKSDGINSRISARTVAAGRTAVAAADCLAVGDISERVPTIFGLIAQGRDEYLSDLEFAQDKKRLETGMAPEELAVLPLWTKVPKLAADSWRALEQHLISIDQDWSDWAKWFGARVSGSNEPILPPGFDFSEDRPSLLPQEGIDSLLGFVDPEFEPVEVHQRPATFQFFVRDSTLVANAIATTFDKTEAQSLLDHLKQSTRELATATSPTNSAITSLINQRALDLQSVLDRRPPAAGDLLALWTSFQSLDALLRSAEGAAEVNLVVRQLTTEVLQRLATLASMSGSVSEIVAYRDSLSLNETQAKTFDSLHNQLARVSGLPAFGAVVHESVVQALRAHHQRKEGIVATAERADDIDVKAQANQDATKIRKLQALDASNLAIGLADGIKGIPPSDPWRKGLKRFTARISDRLPEELADAVIETSATTIRSAPVVVFAFLGSALYPVFGALAGIAPALFGSGAKRLATQLKSMDSDHDQ